jgi:WD40 repeat protein
MSTSRAGLFGTACLFVLLARPTRAEPPRTDDYGDPLPPGAVARLGTVRLRHVVRDGSGAACVVFSPDGKTLVSGGDVGLRAWDVATGKDLGWFPTAPATAARFTADGKTLLTTDNSGSIRLWEAGTGNLLRETKPPRDNGFFHGLDSFLSVDGKVAGETGLGDAVRLWETETGKRIMTRKEEGRSLFFSAALSPDGKTLVVSGEGNRARLLEVATGKEVGQIEGPNKASHLAPGFLRLREESLYWFAFSPDGKTLAGVSGKESFSVWNVADGRLRFTVKDCRGRLAFSPDGKHLLCGGNEAMRLYETATGKEVRRFERHPGFMRALAFSPDGKTVASAAEYTIDLWDVATGKRLHPLAGHATPVVSLAFSPDGSGLASGDSEEGTLIVWNLKDRKPRHTFAGHFSNVLSVAYSPDGKVLASGDGYRRGTTGGFDAQIRLWDPSAGRLLRQFPGHLNYVESLAFSPDGKRLASGGHDARAKVWDVATGQRLLQIRGEDTWFKSAAFSPDGKALLVAGSPGELALWRPDSGRKVRDLGTAGEKNWGIEYVAFLPDGRTVLTCGFGNGRSKLNEVRFWDTENGRLLQSSSFSFGDATRSPGCLALTPDGKTLATGGGYRDPVIQLWDTTTGKRVGRFSGHQGGATESLAFSPDGKTLASGGRDTTVLLWDVARARLEDLWVELAGGQDGGARAGKGLAATPEEAIPFLKDRLRRAADAEDRARRLITGLDDDEFDVREKASRELEGLGPEAAFPLRLALQGSPSAEARRRIQKALDKIKTRQGEPDFQPRGVSLALAVLEEIGTPDARRVLEELAKGPAQSVVTREAGAALERLAKRRKP